MSRIHWWQRNGFGDSAKDIEEQLRLERLEDGMNLDDKLDDEIVEGPLPDSSPELYVTA